MMIPILETERLILRAPAATDCEAFLAFYGSERAQYVGGPLSRSDAWRLFATEIGHWTLRGFGQWAVTMKGDDTALGIIGGWYPDHNPERELGWILFPEAEGKSIAYEAAMAARHHAYTIWGWDTAVSYIDEPNARSRALAERMGARHDPDAATLKVEGVNVLTYRHPAPESPI